MQTIAVLGSGTVGSTLARGWADRYEIVVGSRSTDDPDVRALANEVGGTATDQRAAAADADIAVLAVHGSAVVDLAKSLSETLADTVVIDPTNVLPRPDSGESLAEQVAAAAPDAAVAKAFNTVGANVMADPQIDGGTATMLLAGDAAAVEVAEELAADLGFDPVVAGDLSAAIYLEDLARLWIHLSGEYGRDIAFELLRG
ncbi:MAG: NADPH-dependent F420 reductase [Halapricum sp.]